MLQTSERGRSGMSRTPCSCLWRRFLSVQGFFYLLPFLSLPQEGPTCFLALKVSRQGFVRLVCVCVLKRDTNTHMQTHTDSVMFVAGSVMACQGQCNQPEMKLCSFFFFLSGLRVGTVKSRSGTSQGSHEADLFGMIARAQISSSHTVQNKSNWQENWIIWLKQNKILFLNVVIWPLNTCCALLPLHTSRIMTTIIFPNRSPFISNADADQKKFSCNTF